jgi:formate hydrogenlyase subunit 3/multisubunit Na+/H+ antiporter MnhD subunit
MSLLLTAVGTLILGGFAALAFNKVPRTATFLGVSGAVFGCALGLIAALQVLLGQTPMPRLDCEWTIPYGSFSLAIDGLSAYFLLPLFGLSALAAIYGSEYVLAYRERKPLGVHWFLFNLLIAAMALVITAHNGMLFLIAWEIMTLSAFFLVAFEHEKQSVRDAGWSYLVASHLGVAFLLVLFILLGNFGGREITLDFEFFGGYRRETANLAFVLAVIGFGTKAGFVPLHVWLPEAHPAAPSHVSAVMSGILIKCGIYGILRTLTFLPHPPSWWGWSLVMVGTLSGVLAIVFALAQHDLKRMLAYSSVENIGIITIGMGAGILGMHYESAVLATLGFGGALLHVINHATFKGLLFLCAGSVLHGTGSKEMNRLGGLLKTMPYTGLAFIVGAVAICGLPPLNGFLSEFLIYLGAFKTETSLGVQATIPLLFAIAGLALIGGLAAACFTKAFGVVFLGTPRDEKIHSHESGLAMIAPLLILASICVAIGFFPDRVLGLLRPALLQITLLPDERIDNIFESSLSLMHPIVIGAAAFAGILILLALLRSRLLSGQSVEKRGTWDCGYAKPTARIQYTSSSFSQPLVAIFKMILRTRRDATPPAGIFPSSATLATQTDDTFTQSVYLPLYRNIEQRLLKYRWLQQGRVQVYVLYVALTLLALLVWKLG